MGQRDKDYILSDAVEPDDAYFGAPKPNGKRGRGTDKTSALASVSITGQGHPCFLKIQISQMDSKSVSTAAHQMIRPGSKIHSDALGSSQAALQGAYIHHDQVFEKGSGALHWVRTLISNVKDFLQGTYHSLGKSSYKATSMNSPSASTAAFGPISPSRGLSVPWPLPLSWTMVT